MQTKIDFLYKKFKDLKSERELYEEIIKFGKRNNPFPEEDLLKKNLVEGCQSNLFLSHTYRDNKINFSVHSDALFSLGLASLLTYYYSNVEPKTLFTTPPEFLKELSLLQKISMNRQVGILNLYKKMQLIASKYV